MVHSMTAFARVEKAGTQGTLSWELRSVNGKGLDLRLRVPDWIDGLEAGLRAGLQKALGRGNVSLSLRLSRDEGAQAGPRLNAEVLDVLLRLAAQVVVASGPRGNGNIFPAAGIGFDFSHHLRTLIEGQALFAADSNACMV